MTRCEYCAKEKEESSWSGMHICILHECDDNCNANNCSVEMIRDYRDSQFDYLDE